MLVKVFVTNVSVYMLLIIFAHWLQSLVFYTQKYYWEMVDYQKERQKVSEYVMEMSQYKQLSDIQRDRLILKKMDYFLPQVEILKNRLGNFNPVFFEASEYFDYLSDEFDLFIITKCLHFLEIEHAGMKGECNQYQQLMRTIQSRSALIFFVLVHIPLSRFHSGFCFLTALIPMMLNLQTKFWVYEKTNRAVCYFFKGDKEAKNHVQIPKHLSFENSEEINLEEKSDAGLNLELSKDEQTMQENCVYITTMFLSLYFSLTINYLYSVFLQEVIVSCFRQFHG